MTPFPGPLFLTPDSYPRMKLIMDTKLLIEIAKEVAIQVRRKIPRSANRYFDPEDRQTKWIKNRTDVDYTTFIHTVVRTGTKGATQDEIKRKTKEPDGCFSTRTVYEDASIKDLRRAVLDFVRDGKIEGQSVDLNYKASP